ncbi:MAG: glycosyltransferase [Verrucomicrobia bacterium]|nr:glycosyltransferase [Verrucomicrobiota bacterium]
MRFVFFTHSLLSDWNNGNAHFLRGICAELIDKKHVVTVFEPEESWSLLNLLQERGPEILDEFHATYPTLNSIRYRELDLDNMLAGADVVIVHEWNSPYLIRKLGDYRRKNGSFLLLFHDTHHRAVTEPGIYAQYGLGEFDGVLAYGSALRDIYVRMQWTKKTWVWHEAADVRIFRPNREVPKSYDLIWVGNWGDEERSEELMEFMARPVRELGISAKVYGVRYPENALEVLHQENIDYGGWIPNYKVPEVFSRARITVHVPRRPYVNALPGIPTIRPFEALACGIPLISAPWDDRERLFREGRDLLFAENGKEMTLLIERVLNSQELAESLCTSGLERILEQHTCAHRVEELFRIISET